MEGLTLRALGRRWALGIALLVSRSGYAADCGERSWLDALAAPLEEARLDGRQQATLDEIVRRCRDHEAARALDPSLPPGVVQIDLDFAAFEDRGLVLRGLRAVGSRFPIPELLHPEALPVLPHYDEPGFLRFLEVSGIAARHPDLDPSALFRRFKSVLFPVQAGDSRLVAGLPAYMKEVEEAGCRVVFNTARPADRREVTEQVFREARLPVPVIVMPGEKDLYLSRPRRKAKVQAQIAPYGVTLAFIDDRGENRAAVLEALGGNVLAVPIVHPGFTGELSDAALAREPWLLHTFERFPEP